MTASKSKIGLAFAAVLGLLLVAAAWWIGARPPAGSRAAPVAAPGDLGRPAEPTPDPTLTTQPAPEVSAAPSASTAIFADTTVAWPVKIGLELVRPAHVPRAPGVPPMRFGATARLKGRILRGETGIPASVEFTSGTNAGRVLECNSEGEFGATDLYPGLAEVHVTGPGIESMREVRLRREQTTELNLSYDLPGQFYAKVFDREGKPVEGVDVELDGQHARSDEQGVVWFESVAGGDSVQLVLRKAGMATQSSRVAVAAGRAPDKARYAFTMYPSARLEVVLGPRVGGRDDAVVVLLPEVSAMQRSYPWHRVSPARVKPGGSLVLDDLPAMRLTVRVYHEGAVATPAAPTVFLHAGDTTHQEIRFEAAPSLRGIVVTADGRRVENARVTCEAPDRVATTLQYLEALPRVFEEEILPTFPPAASEVITDFNGQFQVSTWAELGETRYLWAESADGKLWGGRAVTAKDREVELVVAPLAEAQATLELEFPGRRQGLPVVVSIGGRPREEEIVPVDTPVRVEGLQTGTWRLEAVWNGRTILAPPGYQELELAGDTTRSFVLPPGAIDGQDVDTLLRAGRPVPTSAFPVPPPSGDGR